MGEQMGVWIPVVSALVAVLGGGLWMRRNVAASTAKIYHDIALGLLKPLQDENGRLQSRIGGLERRERERAEHAQAHIEWDLLVLTICATHGIPIPTIPPLHAASAASAAYRPAERTRAEDLLAPPLE